MPAWGHPESVKDHRAIAMATDAFPPTAPYLLAIVGRNPDTQPFLRDVEWVAREQHMTFALAVHKRGPLRSWLVGDDIAPNLVGERWNVPTVTWQHWREIITWIT